MGLLNYLPNINKFLYTFLFLCSWHVWPALSLLRYIQFCFLRILICIISGTVSIDRFFSSLWVIVCGCHFSCLVIFICMPGIVNFNFIECLIVFLFLKFLNFGLVIWKLLASCCCLYLLLSCFVSSWFDEWLMFSEAKTFCVSVSPQFRRFSSLAWGNNPCSQCRWAGVSYPRAISLDMRWSVLGSFLQLFQARGKPVTPLCLESSFLLNTDFAEV